MSEEETEKPKRKEKIIGIDLGTSNSACAVLTGTGKPEIVPAAEGRTLGGKAFPSYVAFDESGRKIVGEPARRQAVSNPDGTVTAGAGRVHRFVSLFVNGDEIGREALDRPLSDADRVEILAAIAGG